MRSFILATLCFAASAFAQDQSLPVVVVADQAPICTDV